MKPVTSVGSRCGPAAWRAGSSVLMALVLLTGACSTPFEIKPLVAVDGERLEVAADEPYERAKDFLREGRLGLAIQEFRAALVRQPRSVMVLNGLAIAYDELGRSDLAERYFHRALALRPDSAETLNNIGYSALRRGQVGRAHAAFEQARSLAPQDSVVLANLDLLQQSRPQAAVAALSGSAARDPSLFTAVVARVDHRTQMLLTRPDPQLRTLAIDHAVHPALFVVPALQPTE